MFGGLYSELALWVLILTILAVIKASVTCWKMSIISTPLTKASFFEPYFNFIGLMIYLVPLTLDFFVNGAHELIFLLTWSLNF